MFVKQSLPALAIGGMWLLQLPPTPSFRTNADAVFVHVSVWNGELPVDRLTVADFDVLDNGVKQTVELFSLESVPTDVSLVVDISGSTTDASKVFKRDVQAIAQLLQPQDRVRLITFGARVTEVFPMQPAGGSLPIEEIRPGGPTIALIDALEYSLRWDPGVNRRHLITVFTDGFSAGPMSRFDFLRLLAARTPAVLHIALSTANGRPDLPPAYEALRRAVEETGGEIHRIGGTVEVFRRILNGFRKGYVLCYSPQGIARTGWHEIKINLRRTEKWTVRARRGYYLQ